MTVAHFLEHVPGNWHLVDLGEDRAMDGLLHQRSLPQSADKALDQFASATPATAKQRHHIPNVAAWKPGIKRPAGHRLHFIQATNIG